MPKLSESFIREYFKKAQDLTVFGVPVSDLSREELLAVIVALFNDLKIEREISRRQADLFQTINGA